MNWSAVAVAVTLAIALVGGYIASNQGLRDEMREIGSELKTIVARTGERLQELDAQQTQNAVAVGKINSRIDGMEFVQGKILGGVIRNNDRMDAIVGALGTSNELLGRIEERTKRLPQERDR